MEEGSKMHDAMRVADPTGGLEKCWQGKEMLHHLPALAGTDPDRNQIWNQLTNFYIHYANSGIAQLRRLAWTVGPTTSLPRTSPDRRTAPNSGVQQRKLSCA